MKNKKQELVVYVALFVVFCSVIFFTGFITGFRSGIHRGSFIKESGIREMRRGHFNKPPLPFFKGTKPEFKNKDDILFFLEGADKNIDVTIEMLKSQINIANKWNYSTGKLNEIIQTLNTQKSKVDTMKKDILSGSIVNGKDFINANSGSLDSFKKTMDQIRNELNKLQNYINQSKKTAK